MTKFKCSHCGKVGTSKVDLPKGSRVRCSKCKQVFEAVDPESEFEVDFAGWGFNQPASVAPTPPVGFDQPMLDAVSTQTRSDAETDALGEPGQLELDALSRFFGTHPLGFPTWVVLVVLATLVFHVMLVEKDKGGPNKPMPEAIVFMDGMAVIVSLIFYVVTWSIVGKSAACPVCKAWYSKLLIKSDPIFIGSTDEVRTYTGQAAIRDSNFRVTGYIDEQRTRNVTVKTFLVGRKYRCKSCGHRWDNSEFQDIVT